MAEVNLNRPNWLGSGVGKVVKTIEIPSTFATYTTENYGDGRGDRHIVKSGTYVNDAGVGIGLLYGDIDITEGGKIASLMIRGSYIDAALPATVATESSALAARGLYAFDEGTVVRPDFGDNTLTALGTVEATVPSDSGVVTWTSVAETIGYEVSDANYSVVTITTLTGYTFTTEATFNVRALADNISYAHGAYVPITVTSVVSD
jgi:hypothetical protein